MDELPSGAGRTVHGYSSDSTRMKIRINVILLQVKLRVRGHLFEFAAVMMA
jgi:hypothetical protein